MTVNKPPMGIMPKSAHDHTRARELAQAISSHLNAGDWPPEEWAEELSKLSDEYAPVKLEIKAGAIHHAY